MGLLSDVSCSSYLAYCPRDGGKLGAKSREICYALKRAEIGTIFKVAEHIRQNQSRPGVDGVLMEDTALVPMPRSAPLVEGALWPANILAWALLKNGLGACVIPLLERFQRVPKSSYAPPGMRPTAAIHLESFRAVCPAIPPTRIVVVDDVVTTGATMLAAISEVSKAIPGVPVQGFAFIRTQSWGDLGAICNPKLSRIKLNNDGTTLRRP